MHVCVLGDLDELTAVYIGWLARERGHAVHELPESSLGIDWEYHLDEQACGTLRARDVRLPWDAVSGVFVRLNPEPALPSGLSLDEPHKTGFIQERREGLHQLLEHISGAVINRPSAGRGNASKPYQMADLQSAGFDVPDWIVSNSADAVKAFVSRCGGQAIYKAASGLRSRVRMVDDAFIGRLERGTTPTVVQEYVPGIDVRIHTVGSNAFSCKVASTGVDYRFEHDGASYVSTQIPDELVEQCCSFAQADGLVLAGFDFRLTADGRWRCLEMNPVPSFLPYEFSSGLPIGAAIVDALIGHS